MSYTHFFPLSFNSLLAGGHHQVCYEYDDDVLYGIQRQNQERGNSSS